MLIKIKFMLITGILLFSHSCFSQKTQNLKALNMVKSNLSYLDSTIEKTYHIDKINMMEITHLEQIKSYIYAYCGECKGLRAQMKEIERRLNERRDDLNTGNFVNLKLKQEVDEVLDPLEKDLPKVANHEQLSAFDSKLKSLNIKYSVWMKNNTKMPEWKQISSKRLSDLNAAFEDKKKNIESNLPVFGNSTIPIITTNKLSKYELVGSRYKKFKIIYNSINEIEDIWITKFNLVPDYGMSPNQSKYKKLYKKWQKLKIQEKQLLAISLQDVDLFNVSFVVSDMYLGDNKSFGIEEADSLQLDNGPYHYNVNSNIIHKKLSSNMKVSYVIQIDEMDFEGQRINERELTYTWSIRSEEFDTDHNVQFIIESNTNLDMDSLNFFGKEGALILDLNIKEVIYDIQKSLKQRFEEVIVD